ncbi:MAG: glycerol-3-phosphate 1-O-acyltransferase PlsY [Spirochaetota bacterium]|nr:MAG: glycerol-3-phosphate 1-O-acyltransferase PlsY [Spirochaetota bacterium]
MILRIAYLFILSYLIGGIPTGYLIVKAIKKEDIRNLGSGNIGFTNVVRTTGILPGIVVLIIDIAKAFFTTHYIPEVLPFESILQPVIGIAVIAGNIFNPFLGFKGGKGVATGLGVAIAISPLSVIFSISAFALVVLTTKYVSLGSLTAATIYMLCNVIFYIRETKDIYTLIFSAVLTVAVWMRHISNIQRLIHGEENKIGKRKNHA